MKQIVNDEDAEKSGRTTSLENDWKRQKHDAMMVSTMPNDALVLIKTSRVYHIN